MIYLTPSAEKENFSLESGIDIFGVVFVRLKKICNTYYDRITFLSPSIKEEKESMLGKKFDGIAPIAPSEVSRY